MIRQANEPEPLIINKYKEATIPLLEKSFPNLNWMELEEGVDYSVKNRLKDWDCVIDNNYLMQQKQMTGLQLTDYIISREPIITAYGVMFKKHVEAINPLSLMISGFLDDRVKEKKEMFKYPKGSEDFEKHNLMQQLYKIDANGTYGAIGQHTCIFYNLYISSSVTTQARSLISAASLQFEMFLNNNCKFNSFNEMVTFVGNIMSEKPRRRFKDYNILDGNVTRKDCFIKLVMTCGFDYIPTYEEMDILWNMLMNMDQEDINRVYYKNNLYEFMENSSMTKAIVTILQDLELPFLDPNTPPDCIKPQLEVLCELLMEYVYYDHQIIDRLDKYNQMYRSVSVITDTDSSIISLDGWYNYILQKIYGIDMTIKHQEVDAISYLDVLANDKDTVEVPYEIVDEEEYSFYDEDMIETKRCIDTNKVIPQDGLRYSIINIMAYCLDKVANDYMVRYTENSHSAAPDRKCKMILKNEFLFRRVLLTYNKKNYASIQEIQEGNQIPPDEALDVKGLPMNKSTLNKETRRRLKEILYEDILNTPAIDQIKVLKSLAKLEKDIYTSLSSGSKDYYIPSRIKSMYSYKNPETVQGIKAAMAYNELKDSTMEVLDLTQINSIDIVKVLINSKTIEPLKETNPELYEKISNLLKSSTFKGEITSLAIPINEKTPDWVIDFIDYNTIVSNNIVFPIESLGIYEGKCNYTNVIKL